MLDLEHGCRGTAMLAILIVLLLAIEQHMPPFPSPLSSHTVHQAPPSLTTCSTLAWRPSTDGYQYCAGTKWRYITQEYPVLFRLHAHLFSNIVDSRLVHLLALLSNSPACVSSAVSPVSTGNPYITKLKTITSQVSGCCFRLPRSLLRAHLVTKATERTSARRTPTTTATAQSDRFLSARSRIQTPQLAILDRGLRSCLSSADVCRSLLRPHF